MPQPIGWITATETVATLAALEPSRPVSMDALRNWDRLGVVPAGRVKNGRTLVYSCDDVALLRVIVRLREAGASQQHTASALRFLRVQIADAFRSDDVLVLVMDWRGCAAVVPASRLAHVEAYGLREIAQQIDLRDCWRGCSKQMRIARDRRPAVLWDGRRKIAAKDVTAA
jgi:DNA-binding transcriptional MerR regulator